MDLSFFLNQNVLDAGNLFFKEILGIRIAPATKSEINIKEFLRGYLTDDTLLNKIADARLIGMVNDLSIEGIAQNVRSDEILRTDTVDYDMLIVFGVELAEGIYPTSLCFARVVEMDDPFGHGNPRN